MAISRVQSKSAQVSPGTSVSVTFDSATTTGNLLVLAVSCYYAGANAGGTWTASDNKGNTWSSATVTDTFSKMQVFYVENAAGGSSHQVTLTVAGSSTYLIITALEYSGVATSSALDKSGSAYTATNTTSYTSPTTATTAQANEVLIGCHHAYQSSATPTPASGWSTVVTQSGSSFHTHTVQDQIVSTTGAYASSGTWSVTGANHTDAIVTFKEASASGGTGDLAVTLAGNTLSSTGSVALTGTAAPTLGAVTVSSTGTVALTGSLSTTLGATTLAAEGTLAASGLNGTLAVTLGSTTVSSASTLALAASSSPSLAATTVAAAGTVALKGALAGTLGDTTLASTGVTGSFVAGEAAITLAGTTLSADAKLAIAGTSSPTVSAVTVSSTAALALTGTVSATLGALTLSSSGLSGTRTGSLAVTLGDIGLSATVFATGPGSFTDQTVTKPSYTISPLKPLAPYAVFSLTSAYTQTPWRVL